MAIEMIQDYASLGFKAGIEIHQQLETHKLFCACPSVVHDGEPEFIIHRQLFASAGESGEIDKAAAYESAKRRTYHYEGRSTSSCLVEIDEEPPHEINEEALHTVLLVAKLLHASIVDTVIIMRKVVIDGSNVSGFQRTALVATDGYIETSKGKVSIPTICLEEESAKKIREDKDSVTYRLDRLGIALIEIATGPQLQDPEHVQEAAKIIGSALRATGKVKRGIGTIRQDVNVSIAKGARVEIKGFQDLRSIPKVVEYEVERQIADGTDSHVRKAEENLTTTYLRPMPGAARMYPETDIPLIFISQALIDNLKPPRDPQEELSRIVSTYGITTDQAQSLLKNKGLLSTEVFEHIMQQLKNIKGGFVADVLLSYEKEIRRINPNAQVEKITLQAMQQALVLYDQGTIAKESLYPILSNFIVTGQIDPSQFSMANDEELEQFIKTIITQNPTAPAGTLIGKVMQQYRGKVDGKKVMQMINEMKT